MRTLIIILSVTFGFQARGAGLTTPFSMGSTAVLPKGVRNVRVGGISTMVDGWYNDTGVTAGVAEPFNQQLSYGRLLKAESNENLKLNVESQLRNKGVPLDTIAGTSYADINTRAVVTLPAIAYGLTEKWTVAIAVPIVYTNLSVATGFVGTPQLQQLVDDFSQKSQKQTGLIEEKLTDVIATEISNKGYKPLASEEQTRLGDVVLVAKFLAFQNLNYSWALTNTFTLPTAHVRDVNKVVDPTPGDGQFDYGIASTIEVPINGRISLINQTGYTIQFADTRETRIPISKEERLSRDVDYGANRDLGDQVYSSFGGTFAVNPIFGIGGSYTLAYKERDQWRGGMASPERYEVLGVETEQFMQAVFAQTTFSTVSLFQAKKFPVPMMASLGVGKVIDGRNVRHNSIWSMDVSVFF